MRTMRSHTARFTAAAGLLMLISLDAAAQQRVDTSRAPRTPNAGARARQGMPAGTPGGVVQGPARGMRARAGGMEQGPGARGMRQGGNPAAQMLRMRQQLGLTDEQVQKLETLAKADAPRGNAADALRARADLMEATRGDVNLSAARAALDKMSRLRNEQVVAGLKQRQDARAVLTADQRRIVDNARQRAGQRLRAVAAREGAMRQRAIRGGSIRGGRGMGPQFQGQPMRGPQFRGQPMRGPQFQGQPMRGPQFQGQPTRGPQFRGRMQPVPPVPPVDAAPPANLDVDNFPPMH